MRVLHDRAEIGRRLALRPVMNLYQIGDLDDAFWPFTQWYESGEDPDEAPLLLYLGAGTPCLLGFCEPAQVEALAARVGALADWLPGRLVAHLTEGVREALPARFRATLLERTERMVLRAPRLEARPGEPACERLGMADIEALLALYERAYPAHWFVPKMLESGRCVGVWEDGALIATAGLHVISPALGVAALGNIAVDPGHRRRGLGRAVTAALCRDLSRDIATIGLNVHAENLAARRTYEGLGFELVGAFEEVALELRG